MAIQDMRRVPPVEPLEDVVARKMDERDQLTVSLIEIVRWATANLSPEFIRDTPARHYRVVASLLAGHMIDNQRQLALELADVFNAYAASADAWAVKRGARGAETAPPNIENSPYPIEVAAAYSMKTQGNAGVFDGAKRGSARKPGVITRFWHWLF